MNKREQAEAHVMAETAVESFTRQVGEPTHEQVFVLRHLVSNLYLSDSSVDALQLAYKFMVLNEVKDEKRAQDISMLMIHEVMDARSQMPV